jgi:hypothetical protein
MRENVKITTPEDWAWAQTYHKAILAASGRPSCR